MRGKGCAFTHGSLASLFQALDAKLATKVLHRGTRDVCSACGKRVKRLHGVATVGVICAQLSPALLDESLVLGFLGFDLGNALWANVLRLGYVGAHH